MTNNPKPTGHAYSIMTLLRNSGKLVFRWKIPFEVKLTVMWKIGNTIFSSFHYKLRFKKIVLKKNAPNSKLVLLTLYLYD